MAGRRSRPPEEGARIEGRALRLGDRSVPLYSGAMHYFRVEREHWRAGLKQLRALGLPLVETYIPWGVHERAPGDFDFGQHRPQLDAGAFLDLAHELGLYAIVRPGPHINAELTYFGLPERVIYERACQARSPQQNAVIQGFPPRMFPIPSYASDAYHQEVERWFEAVAEVVAPRLWPEGPVVLLQVDNEGAYYFRDGPYEQDYHPDAIELYHRFLKERHGSLKATSKVHGRGGADRPIYRSWSEVRPPTRFDAEGKEGLPIHLGWARFREELLTRALRRMRKAMQKVGLKGVPTLHNLPLGEQGISMSLPAVAEEVELAGLDYYHPREDFPIIKRRTLYMEGTLPFPYAPELGVGAPPWFVPLAHEDSLFCTLVACAYGLRGFNLYMAVDRDRWYGAPIDSQGNPRLEAGAFKHLLTRLSESAFHTLVRRVEVGLVIPREYARLSKATSLFGPISPGILEATTGSPVVGCREDALGFEAPIQTAWWAMLERLADALTRAGVPYVYVDGDAPEERWTRLRLLFAPSYEYVDEARWRRLTHAANEGVTVAYGPKRPMYDERMRPHLHEVPRNGILIGVESPEEADELVRDLIDELGLERPFLAEPPPVETSVHHGPGGAKLLFVINPSAKPLEARIALPRAMAFEDAMNGERFAGGQSIHLKVGARSCRMLLVKGGSAEGTAQRARVAGRAS